MTLSIPQILLNSGRQMPQLGLGVWQATDDEAERVVHYALAEAGYTHIDTAAGYENEAGVGRAIARAGLDRDDLFVTTKLRNQDQGYQQTLDAFSVSLDKLGLDYVDLYLIHWPLQNDQRRIDTWRALEEIRDSGRVRSIGVSNFEQVHLDQLRAAGASVPAVNQIELHPGFNQDELRERALTDGTAITSWSPLGGTSNSGWGPGSKPNTVLTDPVIAEIAAAHGRSAAQVIIRWHLQNGLIVIPKSLSEARISENIQVFDFELSAEELARITHLPQTGRVGADPLVADFGAPAE
ncbi:aldo/keto reductase [Mycetocola saprophilus]|uniref:aldo/keto reductase n=1 Tax=Mycetocola saprophilus TaxID=76636 RepID=UPI0004C03B70|nr:aldo/keto reductase [Mycetocola saprophilus]